MKKNKFLTIVVAIVFLASCAAKIPYTTGVQEKYKLGENEIKSLQFYLAGDVSIYNGSSSSGNTQAKDGELVIENNEELNKVYIPNGTRGIIERVEGNTLYVSFEEGKNLKFEPTQSDGKYRIAPDVRSPNKSELTYGGVKYFTTSSSLRAYLVFKLKNSTKKRSTQKVVKGRKL